MGAYLNQREKIVSGATMSASFTTDIVYRNYGYGALQVVWSSSNGGNASFRLQASVDGTNFNDITSSAITILSGSSNQVYRLRQIGEEVIRCVYSMVSNTGGSIDIWHVRKGHI